MVDTLEPARVEQTSTRVDSSGGEKDVVSWERERGAHLGVGTMKPPKTKPSAAGSSSGRRSITLGVLAALGLYLLARISNTGDLLEADRFMQDKLAGDDDDDGEEDDSLEKQLEAEATLETTASSNRPSIDDDSGVDATPLQQRYGISTNNQQTCVERLRTRLTASAPWRSKATIHDELQTRLEDLAFETACSTSRKYVIYRAPHFSGGRQQFKRYFDEHGWIGTFDVQPTNRSSFDKIPESTVALIAPCLYSLPFRDLKRRVEVLSVSPNELRAAIKIPFYQSIVQLFDELKCDYRTFHPESFLIENDSICRDLVQAIAREPKNALWFFKERQDSFGSGVKVKTATQAADALGDCSSKSMLSRKPFVQRGVSKIIKYEGRTSQGRSYFLISNYAPFTVWYFAGYFNIAGVTAVRDTEDEEWDLKSAHVTNTKSNQKSSRLLLKQFLKDLSREQLMTVKSNIRQAALTAFLALKPKLGHPTTSFTMFGFDYLVQSDLNVKVLETNCNCELFINEGRHGKERVTISTNLVRGMMDIVLVNQLVPQQFSSVMEEFVVKRRQEMISEEESLRLDENNGARTAWELLYTEAVNPAYSVVDLNETCAPVDPTGKIVPS